MPGFLGGSDLAVPVTSSNKALAADWIKDFTKHRLGEGACSEEGRRMPNATNLLGDSVNERAAFRPLVRPDRRAPGSTSRTAISCATSLGADPGRGA